VHDITEAPRLIEAIGHAQILIADKGYDSDVVVALACRKGMHPCISQRPKRLAPLVVDKAIYRARHLVENFFQKIKRCRRIATRFEKNANHFLQFLKFACILVWLA